MQIGPLTLRNPYALAPMAGLSDVPFRTMAWRMGAGYMVSEMVTSKPELWESGKSRLRRIPVPGVNPVAIQIAGTDPEIMADAARRHVDDGVQIIDINFGCPAKKVCRKSAGSALLGDIDLIGRIVHTVSRAVSVPVTVKTRVGLVVGDDLGVEAGRVAADNGAQLVVMHGRSRACKFNGHADYAPVRRLKSLIDVPVLVNGDIQNAEQAQAALARSGADGVMIGRGAVGQPWVFAELTGRPTPGLEQKWSMVIEHVRLMHDFYGEEAGVRIARKHIIAYLEKLDCSQSSSEVVRLAGASVQLEWLTKLAQRQLERLAGSADLKRDAA